MVENVSSELVDGAMPEVTTMTDVNGKPIAILCRPVPHPGRLQRHLTQHVRAIISIEDRRFLEHDGVDWKGTLRAALKNSSSGEVQRGASTLDQQYIKNYQLLVLARTEAEREVRSGGDHPARKLREVRMALTMEQTLRIRPREKGLSDVAAKREAKPDRHRYLNVVPFGNNSYGIEAAAQTHFGKKAGT